MCTYSIGGRSVVRYIVTHCNSYFGTFVFTTVSWLLFFFGAAAFGGAFEFLSFAVSLFLAYTN